MWVIDTAGAYYVLAERGKGSAGFGRSHDCF